MNDIAELLPIKLTPGFIAVAFHLGCIGCNFCSVRYGNSRDRIFSSGFHGKYPLTPAEILGYLRGMPSFHRATVPVRIGNDTDLRFELDQAVELLDLLPSGYPAAVLTRFPISRDAATRLTRPNLVVKFTATPLSKYLTCPDNAVEVIESAGFFGSPVLLTLGPVTADNYECTRELLGVVPRRPNISIYIKPLNDEFHTSLREIPAISPRQYAELRHVVAAFGFRHVSQLMCVVNEPLGLRYKRVSDVPADERTYCIRCKSEPLCYSADEVPMDLVRHELATLGLTLQDPPARIAFKSYVMGVEETVGLGDEAYLSDVLGIRMKLAPANTNGPCGSCAASTEVLERWDRVGFFPYWELRRRVGDFIEESIRAADNRFSSINQLAAH